MIQSDPARFYLDGEYEKLNPSWDTEDSTWKAAMVSELLARHQLRPRTLAEIGCGAGAVLSALQGRLPNTELYGWDIAPGASRFWDCRTGIKFTRGDFLAESSEHFDVLLLLDVIEHVANPHAFLSQLAPYGTHIVLHIPLDLSAASVLREQPLLQQRRSVGHIHYFTRKLALELLAECGYEVVESAFSGAHLRPRATWGGKLASLARRAVFACGRETGVRLLGGDTLLVLATPGTGARAAVGLAPNSGSR